MSGFEHAVLGVVSVVIVAGFVALFAITFTKGE